MGCSSTREKLESRMLILKLKKNYIDNSNNINDEESSENSSENYDSEIHSNSNKNSSSKNSHNIESYSYESSEDLVNDRRIKKK